jgi:hypothetical protein
MKTTIVMLREPRALAVPGWKGGPAPFASMALGLIFLGRHARRPQIFADNDNGVVAA